MQNNNLLSQLEEKMRKERNDVETKKREMVRKQKELQDLIRKEDEPRRIISQIEEEIRKLETELSNQHQELQRIATASLKDAKNHTLPIR